MSNYILYNGELYHYGVPGMKWGRRKARQEARANRKAARQEARANRKAARQELKGNSKIKDIDPNSKKSRVGREVVTGLLATGAMGGLTMYSILRTNKNDTTGLINSVIGLGATAVTGVVSAARIAGAAITK